MFSVVAVLMMGCGIRAREIPFPDNEREYIQPVSRPFVFSEPRPVNWANSHPDSLRPPTIKRLDLKQIPPTSIDMEEFKPLRAPITETQFEWNSLPGVAFDFSKLPSQPLSFKTAAIARPKRIKSDFPHSKEDATTGILTFGEDQLVTSGGGGALLPDHLGMLWIGIANGLYRYDGEFLDFYTIGVDENRIHITSLAEDQDGKIWIGTIENGIYILDYRTGMVKRLTIQQGLDANQIYRIYCDRNGLMWIGTLGGGIAIADQQTGKLNHLGTKEGLSDKNAFDFLEDREGRMWISTRNQVNIIDGKAGRMSRMGETEGLSSNLIEYFLEDKKGQMWISTDYQMNLVNPKTGSIKHIGELQGLSGNQTNHLLEDESGMIWIGTNEGGVEVLNEKDQTIKHLSMRQGLSNNTIFDLVKDRFGQIWIADGRAGINIARTNAENIRHLKLNQEINKNPIYGLLEDSLGRLWLGSQGNGLYLIDPRAGTNIKIALAQGLKSTNFSTLLSVNGNVWIATDEGIDIIDQKSSVIRHISTAAGSNNEIIFSLLKGQGDVVLAGGVNGLQQLNAETGKVERIATTSGLMNDTIFSMLQDRSGQLWIGTIRGLNIIDINAGTIKQIRNIPNLNDNLISSLVQDSSGIVWVGCQKGIYAIDPTSGISTHFSPKEGLADMAIRSLICKGNKIYAGTAKGLTLIRPSLNNDHSWQVKTYGKSQGFPDINFRVSSALKSRNGQLMFGFKDMLTLMDSREEDTIVPAAFITGMDIVDKPYYFRDRTAIQRNLSGKDSILDPENGRYYSSGQSVIDSIYPDQHDVRYDSVVGPYNMPVNLRLPYHQNYLSFQFTGNHLANSDKTYYRYILEGVDKNWSPVTDKPTSENYRDLSPGKYTFRVASEGFNGRWSHPAEFQFTINPPWWKTWLAYAIYAVLIATGLWMFTSYRSKRLIHEKHALEEKVNLRTAEVVKQKEEIAVQRDNLENTLHELKNAQSQLVQSEKMASLGELTAGVAHEIQNPLNFVNNFSEVNLELLEEMKQDLAAGNIASANTLAKDIQHNLEKVIHHGKRADAIVKGMLQHSRSNTGQKEPTDINALADEYLRLSFHGLRAKDKLFNAAMKTDFDARIGMVNIIPQDMGRVLLNLYNNAFYAVAQKKTILGAEYMPLVQVTTKRMGNKFEIRVRDNGMGVPQKVVDKIYQPFFTTKPTGQGTGLGLSLSYDIITKQHDGTLKLDTKEGEFAEFIIVLPIDAGREII